MKLNFAWRSSDALFRLFGHPRILRMAASLLGDDFVAHGGGVIVKPPRLGPAFAWHQVSRESSSSYKISQLGLYASSAS